MDQEAIKLRARDTVQSCATAEQPSSRAADPRQIKRMMGGQDSLVGLALLFAVCAVRLAEDASDVAGWGHQVGIRRHRNCSLCICDCMIQSAFLLGVSLKSCFLQTWLECSVPTRTFPER